MTEETMTYKLTMNPQGAYTFEGTHGQATISNQSTAALYVALLERWGWVGIMDSGSHMTLRLYS